jgi:hypothetical protein
VRKLNYELKQLCEANRDGSYSTQKSRSYALAKAANDLHDLGFKNMGKNSLKLKHVEALLKHWRANDVTNATLKNRLTHIRWWADHLKKPGLLPKNNDAFGVGKRTYVSGHNKAVQLDGRFADITDLHVRLSLRMQEAFGLRREESIKFNADYAHRGDKIVLKPSWTKGGRPREIPIRNEQQRLLLAEVRKLVGPHALIPQKNSYVQQLKVYENQLQKADFHKMHGLRHAYAQARYHEITGWSAPVAGGPKRANLDAKAKDLDNHARQIISRELGHERREIVAVYLGN